MQTPTIPKVSMLNDDMAVSRTSVITPSASQNFMSTQSNWEQIEDRASSIDLTPYDRLVKNCNKEMQSNFNDLEVSLNLRMNQDNLYGRNYEDKMVIIQSSNMDRI